MTAQSIATDASAESGGIQIGVDSIDGLQTAYRPLEWKSADGLTLSGRDYGNPDSARTPIVCLAGLTRTVRDFEPVAAHLAPLGLRVITLDSRGRGGSDRDPNPSNYNPMVELADALKLVDGLGLAHIDAIGTSRGGILMMIAALMRPGMIRRAVLNDIGPRIELAGLLKIKGYVGRDLGDMTWGQAVFSLAVSQGRNFPRLDDAGWDRFARRLWRDVRGKPVMDYDPALAQGLQQLTDETQLPESWEGLAALAQNPVLVLRGSLSDILSDATVTEMVARFPTVERYDVPDEAHAPLLEDAATLARITRFFAPD